MKRILIVDDEPQIPEMLSLMLQILGMPLDIVIAKDSVEALELVSKEKFDLLITDNNMPNVTGVEIARKLREVSPKTKIMMISGKDFEVQHVREEGLVDELIAKPFVITQILDSVRPFLGIDQHAHAA